FTIGDRAKCDGVRRISNLLHPGFASQDNDRLISRIVAKSGGIRKRSNSLWRKNSCCDKLICLPKLTIGNRRIEGEIFSGVECKLEELRLHRSDIKDCIGKRSGNGRHSEQWRQDRSKIECIRTSDYVGFYSYPGKRIKKGSRRRFD